MGCCGSKRMLLNTAQRSARSGIPVTTAAHVGHARPVFVYRGDRPLKVIGRVSGTPYYFTNGTRVSIDARDAASLLRSVALERVV